MQVEPTGIVMYGTCEVQSGSCSALSGGPITAVWELPGRQQVNVCRQCLQEMVRAGEWRVPHAQVPARPDIEVQSNDKVVLLVEVRRVPAVTQQRRIWAERLYRNLVVHGSVDRTVPFFLLAAWPPPFYLWRQDAVEPAGPADFEIQLTGTTRRRLAPDASPTERDISEQLAKWLLQLVREPHRAPEALVQSGLLKALGSSPLALVAPDRRQEMRRG